MTAPKVYIWLICVFLMFLMLCASVYSYGRKYSKEFSRNRSPSIYTVAMPNCANQSGPFAQILYPPVRVDLPPTYDQVIIEINREATETVRTA